MNNKNGVSQESVKITTANNTILTLKDLREAARMANVDWNIALYANNIDRLYNDINDAIDVCVLDIFSEGAWSIIEDPCYEDFDETEDGFSSYCDDEIPDEHLRNVKALCNIIESRFNTYKDWANQRREEEELCHRVNGDEYSKPYLALYCEAYDETEDSEIYPYYGKIIEPSNRTAAQNQLLSMASVKCCKNGGSEDFQNWFCKIKFGSEIEYHVTIYVPNKDAEECDNANNLDWDNYNVTIEKKDSIIKQTNDGIRKMYNMPFLKHIQKNENPTSENDEECTTDLSWIDEVPESISFPDSHSK